jgi:uncharacterized membrane protein YgcG
MPALRQLLAYPSRQLLPYCLCPALQALLLVQHAPGYRPTSAPFLFVGQRNSVTKIVAVPWACAEAVAEALPEATELGPVLVVHMTGRCGSTLLTKALDWLGCAQAASEPEVFTDVHELLERGLLTRPQAVKLLRAACLLLVHRLRADRPDRPLVVLKPRSLTATWRCADLLPEALPGAKHLLVWRRADEVVGSFDAAVVGAMGSPVAKAMHGRGLDGRLWPRGVKAFLKQLVRTMAAPPAPRTTPPGEGFGGGKGGGKGSGKGSGASGGESGNEGGEGLWAVSLDAETFARHGALGFSALNVAFAFHVAINLHRALVRRHFC